MLINRIQSALKQASGPVCEDCLRQICLIGGAGMLASLQSMLEEEGLLKHSVGKYAICNQERMTSRMNYDVGKESAGSGRGASIVFPQRAKIRTASESDGLKESLVALTEMVGKQSVAAHEVVARLISLESTVQKMGDAVRLLVSSNPPGGRFAVYQGDHLALTCVLNLFKMYVDTTEAGLAPHLMMDGRWEPDITRIFEREIRTGMTVVDGRAGQ